MRRALYVVSLEIEHDWCHDNICTTLNEVSNCVAEFNRSSKERKVNGEIVIHIYDYDKLPKYLFEEKDETSFLNDFFKSYKDILKTIPFDYRK